MDKMTVEEFFNEWGNGANHSVREELKSSLRKVKKKQILYICEEKTELCSCPHSVPHKKKDSCDVKCWYKNISIACKEIICKKK